MIRITPAPSAAEQRITSALDDDTRLEFIEVPLEDAMTFLRDQHDIPIVLDTRALDDVGIGTDVPITRSLKGVSLRSTLRLILHDLDLVYCIDNEVLVVTTPHGAVARTKLKIYDVSGLLEDGERAQDVAVALQQILASASAPGMYGYDHGYAPMGGMGDMYGGEDYGGGYGEMGGGIGSGYGDEEYGEEESGYGGMSFAPGPSAESIMAAARRIVPYKHLLLVRDTTAGHEEVSNLLQSLGSALKRQR